MVSSYTTNKLIEKPANGDYVDTWNIPVNGDMDVIDQALGSTTYLNATGGSALLTFTQFRSMALSISGAMSGNVIYTIPAGIGGSWIVYNGTTDATGGPWSVTIASGGGGTSVVIKRGFNTTVYSDGTNIRLADNSSIAGGSDTQVQFNQATQFGGSPNFVFDYTNNRVGIGTASPATRLHVLTADGVTNARFAGASYAIRTQSAAAVGASIDATDATESTYQPLLVGGSQIQFTIAGSEKMRLSSAGYLGLNTTTPGQLLDVNGNISSPTAAYVFSYQGGTASQVRSGMFMDGGNNQLAFFTAANSRMTITSAGNVGINVAAPTTQLQVQGPAGVTAFTGTSSLGVRLTGSAAANDYTGIDFNSSSATTPYARIASYFSGGGSYLVMGTSNNYASGITNAAITIDPSGRVGIGTSNPSYSFQVGGYIASTSGGYVFPDSTIQTSAGVETVNAGRDMSIARVGNSVTIASTAVPVGAILMWSGSIASIPATWALCDGNNGTPDLRNRFIVGAGGSGYNVGNFGGVDSVTLSVNEIPAHTHSFSATTSSAGTHTHSINDPGHTHAVQAFYGGAAGPGTNTSLDSGFNASTASATTGISIVSAGAHTHTVSGTSGSTGGGGSHENRPPYYALAYIMKIA